MISRDPIREVRTLAGLFKEHDANMAKLKEIDEVMAALKTWVATIALWEKKIAALRELFLTEHAIRAFADAHGPMDTNATGFPSGVDWRLTETAAGAN